MLSKLSHYVFFSVLKSAHIRFRQRITKKKCVFFCPARALDCCKFPKIFQLISGDKKNILKKTSLSREIFLFFQLCVFLLVFHVTLINFFSNNNFFTSFCYFVALINFSKKLSNVFFFVALINFSKNMFNVFFYCPPSLDFEFFLI